jgi:hypothetical protein
MIAKVITEGCKKEEGMERKEWGVTKKSEMGKKNGGEEKATKFRITFRSFQHRVRFYEMTFRLPAN